MNNNCNTICLARLLWWLNELIYVNHFKTLTTGSDSRWWYKRILNSSPPTKTATYRTTSSEKNLKSGWSIPMYQVNKKRPTLKPVGEAGTQSHQKPYSWCGDPQSGGNLKCRSSPWGEDLHLRDEFENILVLKTNGIHIHEIHKPITIWEWLLKCPPTQTHPLQGPAWKWPIQRHPHFVWHWLICLSWSTGLRSRHLI